MAKEYNANGILQSIASPGPTSRAYDVNPWWLCKHHFKIPVLPEVQITQARVFGDTESMETGTSLGSHSNKSSPMERPLIMLNYSFNESVTIVEFLRHFWAILAGGFITVDKAISMSNFKHGKYRGKSLFRLLIIHPNAVWPIILYTR